MNARLAELKEKSKPDCALIDDIGTALRFIEEDYTDTLASLDSLLANGQITYDLLWAIFPPKATLIASKHGLLHKMQAVILASSGYAKRPNGTRYFYINGGIITHDGTDFGLGHLELIIEAFDGAEQITKLEACPLIYLPDWKAVQKDLIIRGRKYLSIIDKPICFEQIGESAAATTGIKEIIVSEGKRQRERFNVGCRTFCRMTTV